MLRLLVLITLLTITTTVYSIQDDLIFINKLTVDDRELSTTSKNPLDSVIPLLITAAKIHTSEGRLNYSTYLMRQCKSNSDCDVEGREVCYKLVGWCVCKECEYLFNCECGAAVNKTTNNTTTTATATPNEDRNNRYMNRVAFKRTFDQTHNTNYLYKNYDLANTYTFGFGFGLPVILVFLIIAILIYCLRKKYSDAQMAPAQQHQQSLLATGDHQLVDNSNSSPAFMSQRQISSLYIFNNNNRTRHNSQSNPYNTSSSDTESTVSSNFYDENQAYLNDHHQNSYANDLFLINVTKPPIYDDISNFSEIDKLPTYDSFRRKSKSNVLV